MHLILLPTFFIINNFLAKLNFTKFSSVLTFLLYNFSYCLTYKTFKMCIMGNGNDPPICVDYLLAIVARIT